MYLEITYHNDKRTKTDFIELNNDNVKKDFISWFSDVEFDDVIDRVRVVRDRLTNW